MSLLAALTAPGGDGRSKKNGKGGTWRRFTHADRLSIVLHLPQVSHGLYTFSYRFCHFYVFLTFPSTRAPPTLSTATVPEGLHSTTTECNSTTSPSEDKAPSASSTSTHSLIEDPGPKSLRIKFHSLFLQFLHVQIDPLLQPEQA